MKRQYKQGSIKYGCWAIFAAAVLLTGTLLTGCGHSASSTADTSSTYGTAGLGNTLAVKNAGKALQSMQKDDSKSSMMKEAAPNASQNGVQKTSQDGTAAAQTEVAAEQQSSGRKFVTTMNISAETENFDQMMQQITTQVTQLGGYIENSQVDKEMTTDQTGTSTTTGNYRSAALTVRIPAEKLDQFVNQVIAKTNVTSQSKNVQDVTLSYVDLESHKKALQTEEDRLLQLMQNATTTKDMIAIEDKLADVRYQLDSMESQLRTFDNQINYSTVYLNLQEVKRTTPHSTDSIWGKISNGLGENIYRIGQGMISFFIGLIVSLPLILLFAVVAFIVFLIVRLILRKVIQKKRKHEDSDKTEADSDKELSENEDKSK